MRTSEADILIVPGLGDSGPDHWQSRWQSRLSTAQRVDQGDWNNPVMTDWTARIVRAVAACSRPVVIVAHSLGALAVAHAAGELDRARVAGAFLVAPPSERAVAGIDEIDAAFYPAPRATLPFRALLVASRSDPFASFPESEEMAAAWGAALVDAGDSGHINAESGHGPWPEGLMRFGGFLAKL
jgi:predicted alpha/beta hydrolase family esterase